MKNGLYILAISWLLLFAITAGFGQNVDNGQWSIFGYFSYSNGNYYLTETTRSFYTCFCS